MDEERLTVCCKQAQKRGVGTPYRKRLFNCIALRNRASLEITEDVIKNTMVLWERRRNKGLFWFLSSSYNFLAKYLFPAVKRELGLLVAAKMK